MAMRLLWVHVRTLLFTGRRVAMVTVLPSLHGAVDAWEKRQKQKNGGQKLSHAPNLRPFVQPR